MQTTRLLLRVTAALSAVALTICGAYLASSRAGQNLMQTAGTTASRQVVILDAGHGAST